MKLALILLAVYLAQVRADAWVGCVGRTDLPRDSLRVLRSSTLAGCQSRCSYLPYSYWRPITNACYCSSSGPGPRDVQTGSPTSCIGYMVSKVETTFSDASCATTITQDRRDANSPSSSVSDIGDCLENCKSYRYAIVQSSGGFFAAWNCKCGNFPYTASGSRRCSGFSNYVYTHSAAAAASALSRREIKAEARRQQLAMMDNPHCPAGYLACNVSEEQDDGYECISPEVELESCGGCRYGEYEGHNSTLGVDCTSLPGVLRYGVTCHEGQCVVSRCRRGFRLAGGQCIPRSK